MAHFDPDGQIAPHVRRHIEAWSGFAERLIVVTTSHLTPEAREWVSGHAELLERDNYGYDFMSYKAGLDHAGDLAHYGEVVLCNDSFVGPLRSYAELFAHMAARPVDFWGLTLSNRIHPHLQSFFVVFRPWVVRSRTFRDFWSGMVPVSDRQLVIHRYEVGLTRALAAAGFTPGSYFEEDAKDRRAARRRMRWWAWLRLGGRLTSLTSRTLRTRAAEAWNPTYALADRALDRARMPFVKLDTLRFDPMGLDARGLLARCETAFPREFEGVADFLARTKAHYPPRPMEKLGRPAFPAELLRRGVDYR